VAGETPTEAQRGLDTLVGIVREFTEAQVRVAGMLEAAAKARVAIAEAAQAYTSARMDAQAARLDLLERTMADRAEQLTRLVTAAEQEATAVISRSEAIGGAVRSVGAHPLAQQALSLVLLGAAWWVWSALGVDPAMAPVSP